MPRDDEQLISKVNAALDESVAQLDGATRSRLAQARAHALQPRRARWVWWLPAGGAVFASLLIAALWLGRPAVLPANGYAEAQDFELLTSSEEIDLLQDLDFYQWLESREESHAG